MLTRNKKMINLVKYVVEILGLIFEGQQPPFISQVDKENFFEILSLSLTEYPENGDLIKELLRVCPLFYSPESPQ